MEPSSGEAAEDHQQPTFKLLASAALCARTRLSSSSSATWSSLQRMDWAQAHRHGGELCSCKRMDWAQAQVVRGGQRSETRTSRSCCRPRLRGMDKAAAQTKDAAGPTCCASPHPCCRAAGRACSHAAPSAAAAAAPAAHPAQARAPAFDSTRHTTHDAGSDEAASCSILPGSAPGAAVTLSSSKIPQSVPLPPFPPLARSPANVGCTQHDHEWARMMQPQPHSSFGTPHLGISHMKD